MSILIIFEQQQKKLLKIEFNSILLSSSCQPHPLPGNEGQKVLAEEERLQSRRNNN